MSDIREYSKDPRCEEWMPYSQAWCGRRKSHPGRCRSPQVQEREARYKYAKRNGLPVPARIPRPDGYFVRNTL